MGLSGIAGIFQMNNEPVFHTDCDAMMEALAAFPADDTRTWGVRNVFFGYRGQWITPQSVQEKLPRYDAGCRMAIVADAIIDNRTELFDLLHIDKCEQNSMSDSELILRSYLKWKDQAPTRLVGDFAFMIWDEGENRLFGARDFSGSRTLYYTAERERFAFCTTIRPLLQLSGTKSSLNEQWIAEFLAIHITAETTNPYSTVYQQVHQIPPAHTIEVKEGKIRFNRYCNLESHNKLKLGSDEAYVEAFREVFNIAVRDRTRTNRHVGANLSGGLDSGSVASFASKILGEDGRKLYTFSYVPVDDFDGRPSRGRFANERPYIERTVEYAGNMIPHYFSFPEHNPWTDIDDWLDLYEMPYKFYENSFWIKGIYEEASKRDVGVLLTGQRGNWSISWGPAIDYYGLLMRKMRWLKLYKEVNQYCINMQSGRKRLYARIIRKAFPVVRYFEQTADGELPSLIHPDFAARTEVFKKLHAKGFNRTDFDYQSAYKVRMHQFMDPNIWNLTGTVHSKLSLRHRVWGRDPTNDLRVIRFCLSVPDDQFVQNGMDRALIRRATENYLPDKVRLNMKTRGVQGADGVHRMAPHWREFMNEAMEVIRDPVMKAYVNIQELEKALPRYVSQAKAEYVFEIPFRMLMRAIIFYRFIKKLANRA